MTDKLKDDAWIWVIVQNPGSDEQFLGQYDDKKDLSFIPAFHEKDIALQCIGRLITEKGNPLPSSGRLPSPYFAFQIGVRSHIQGFGIAKVMIFVIEIIPILGCQANNLFHF